MSGLLIDAPAVVVVAAAAVELFVCCCFVLFCFCTLLPFLPLFFLLFAFHCCCLQAKTAADPDLRRSYLTVRMFSGQSPSLSLPPPPPPLPPLLLPLPPLPPPLLPLLLLQQPAPPGSDEAVQQWAECITHCRRRDEGVDAHTSLVMVVAVAVCITTSHYASHDNGGQSTLRRAICMCWWLFSRPSPRAHCLGAEPPTHA